MSFPCPHDSRPLVIQDAEGHVGYGCDSCRGAWLPRKFLQSMEYGRRLSEAAIQNAFAAQLKRPTTLRCPAACGMLEGVYIKGIELDWCPHCKSVWFDRGEVAKLLARYPLLGSASSGGVDALDLVDIAGGIFDIFS